MRDYTRRFSRQCNKLTNLADVDVVSAFISRNTSETLVHKLGQKNLQTTKGLLDIATNHVSVKMWWGDLRPPQAKNQSRQRSQRGLWRGTWQEEKKDRQRHDKMLVAATGQKEGSLGPRRPPITSKNCSKPRAQIIASRFNTPTMIAGCLGNS